MDDSYRIFLSALQNGLQGKSSDLFVDMKVWRDVIRLARAHSVLPMVIDTAWTSSGREQLCGTGGYARRVTCTQAQRTGDFLLLHDSLKQQGLSPVVVKGIVLRSLYPHPEQRASVDEDLIIRLDDFPLYHKALTDYGLHPVNLPDEMNSTYEVTYEDRSRGLCIELHKQFFPVDSETFTDLNRLFTGAIDRCEGVRIYRQDILTLSPTDHLLYLLCHIYKHFLHGGFGIRQVCDIGMLSKRYPDRIDWPYVREKCDEVHMGLFAASVFRITEKYLGFAMPVVFEKLETDERDLLIDILTGGLYGMNDINRAHSSTITLEAVEKQRQGKREAGLAAAVFLPRRSMEKKYPYLKKYPWLLPAAWMQRVLHYLLRKEKNVDPVASIRIGKERLAILREYGIIE